MRFLGFRLYAPLASFGDVAVGQRRPSLSAPTRSMLLGLLAGCLGIPRTESETHAELERAVGVATRTDSPGTLLVDYHTAQNPDDTRQKVWTKTHRRPPATRREELSCTVDRTGLQVALDTQLSTREYRTDAAFAVCVWLRDEQSPFSLDAFAEALKRPVFPPFAGRKAAVLALPFEPTIVEAPNPVAALQALTFSLDDTLRPLTKQAAPATFRWEGQWAGLKPTRTETRRDRSSSRARWQFEPRQEHVWTAHQGENDNASQSN